MTQGAPAARGPSETLLEARVGALIDDLAAAGRVPGAGSVSALVVAMAAAVVAMAARAAADSWTDAKGAIAQAETLRRRALPLADEDARALSSALSLLGVDDAPASDERRDFALGRALATAADVPLAIVQVAADVAALAHAVAEEGSAEVQPDAVGAAVLAAGAAQAAAHLVHVNLATTEEDLRVLAARSLAAAAGSWADRALALRG